MADENNSPSVVTLDNLFQTGTGADNPNNPDNINGGDADNNDKGAGAGDKPDENGTPSNDGTNTNSDNTNDDGIDPRVKVRDYFKSLTDEGIDDENKVVRDKLFSKYKGVSFNAKGDILDVNKEVVATFEQVYDDLENEDDVVVDDKGNQVDADGNIIKTKAEIDAEKSLVNKFNQSLGYEFKDENGNLKSYDDSEEGLQNFAFDIADNKFKELQESFVQNNGLAIEIAKHIIAGGDPSTFNKEENFAEVDINKLSSTAKIDYIRRSFKSKGFSPERIEANISRIEAGNEVDSELVYALEDLEETQKVEKAERSQRADAVIAQQQKEAETYWNDVESTIKNGQLNGLTLSKEEQSAFLDYVTKPVKGQKTQSMLDSEAKTVKDDLTLEFMKFKKYKLGTLVDNKAKSVHAGGLKSLIQRSAKLKEGSFNSKKGNKGGTPKTVTLNDLL